VNHDNHSTPHIEHSTEPLERYRQDPAPATRPVDPTTLRQAFLHRDQRKVTKTATLFFQGNRYRVPDHFRGQTIQLRYDPFDLARLAFALQERLPALITGDVGTGKSTALRAFVHSLDRNLFPIAYLAN
jgi:putative transposase